MRGQVEPAPCAATVLWDYDKEKWVATITSPDGDSSMRCAKIGPLSQWAHDWATARNVRITITIFAGQQEE